MNKLTKLEIAVLQAFVENATMYFSSDIDFESVVGCERWWSGKGFMTTLPIIPELKRQNTLTGWCGIKSKG